MPLANYAATYAEMADDEILRLACEASGLKEEARQGLNAELKKRKLTQNDISECEQRLATLRPGAMAANQKYVARSFAGFGTTLYGKRDFHSDGSYLTTKWITLLWIPVFPLASIRAGKARPDSGAAERKVSEHHLGHYATWTTEYSVYSEGPINRKQVFSVYAFVLAMAAIERSPAYLPRRIVFVLFGTLCMLPWILRRTAPRSRD
jgi:hypothetical protein